MEGGGLICGMIAMGIICAILGQFLAEPKGRGTEGAVFGFLLGPIGCIIAAMMEPATGMRRDVSGAVAPSPPRAPDPPHATSATPSAVQEVARSQSAAWWVTMEVEPKTLSTPSLEAAALQLKTRYEAIAVELRRRREMVRAAQAKAAAVAAKESAPEKPASPPAPPLPEALREIAGDPDAFPHEPGPVVQGREKRT